MCSFAWQHNTMESAVDECMCVCVLKLDVLVENVISYNVTVRYVSFYEMEMHLAIAIVE